MEGKIFFFSQNPAFVSMCANVFSGFCCFEVLNSEKSFKNCLLHFANCIFLCDYELFKGDELFDEITKYNGHKIFFLTTKVQHSSDIPKYVIHLPFGFPQLLKMIDFETDDEENSFCKKNVSFNLAGSSPSVKKLRLQIEQAARLKDCVLFTGESGTGKSLAAKILHEMSPAGKKGKKLITENISAISENLVESELFGVKTGAFTGANCEREGLIGRADGSSIFFDEIGDFPLHLQSKLLLAVQDGLIRKIGSDESRKVDVRFIFATNQDLRNKIKNGGFRKDLFFRISAVEIEIPPLRKRKEDISELSAEYFKKRGLDFSISRTALLKLQDYDWPGNIRELENCLAKAVRNCKKNVIGPELIHFFEQDLQFW